MALFRVDFSGRGELADRQQKLAQMLSRLQKISEGRPITCISSHFLIPLFTLGLHCVVPPEFEYFVYLIVLISDAVPFIIIFYVLFLVMCIYVLIIGL